jgi:hypothetical protein
LQVELATETLTDWLLKVISVDADTKDIKRVKNVKSVEDSAKEEEAAKKKKKAFTGTCFRFSLVHLIHLTSC